MASRLRMVFAFFILHLFLFFKTCESRQYQGPIYERVFQDIPDVREKDVAEVQVKKDVPEVQVKNDVPEVQFRKSENEFQFQLDDNGELRQYQGPIYERVFQDIPDVQYEKDVAEVQVKKDVPEVQVKNDVPEVQFRKGDNEFQFQLDENEEVITTYCVNVTQPTGCVLNMNFRTLDGTCNNMNQPEFGAAFTKETRLFGFSPLKGAGPLQCSMTPGFLDENSDVATAQEVVDKVITLTTEDLNDGIPSALFTPFGQFLDHDIVFTGVKAKDCGNDITPSETCTEDKCFGGAQCPFYNKKENPSKCYKFQRSMHICGTKENDAAFANTITTFIDGSAIYGSSLTQMKGLRSFKDGKMKTTALNGNTFLPEGENIQQPCNKNREETGGCFLAGDGRASVHVGLLSLHTLFVLEHNRICEHLKKINGHWSDDRLFFEARKIVSAQLQHIVYYEYLPAMGIKLKDFKYDASIDPSLSIEFSTAAYRFGHSQLKSTVKLRERINSKPFVEETLQATLFNTTLVRKYGIAPILVGFIAESAEKADLTFAKDIGEKLFIPPGKKGYQSLPALNVQRGRDHRIASYKDVREAITNEKLDSFDDFERAGVFRSTAVLDALKDAYNGDVNAIDLFVGGLAEKPMTKSSMFGPTFFNIIKDQFEKLAKGDRYFYKNNFTKKKYRTIIASTTLARIICLNLDVNELPIKALLGPNVKGNRKASCRKMRKWAINLNLWKESKSYGDEMLDEAFAFNDIE